MAPASINVLELQDQFRLLVEEVEEYAIFMLDPEGHIKTWNEGAEKIKGYSKQEILGTHFSVFYPDEAVERGKPEAALEEAARNGQWVDEHWRIRKDGSRFWGRVTITALRDDRGELRGFGKVTRDMTERRQAELDLKRQTDRAKKAERRAVQENALLRLMQTVAATANEADSLDGAMKEALEAICEHTGWPVGHVYRPSEDGRLIPTEIWYLESEEKFESFRQATRGTTFTEGDGLPGRVALVKEPIWIRDVSQDENFHRADVAQALGIKTAFAFPILLDGSPTGILEFFSTENEEPDRRLMEGIESVGVQLSRVAEREQAKETLRVSEERYRSLQESAPDGIVIADGEGRIIDWNPGASEIFGYDRPEILGRRIERLMPERHKEQHRAGMKRISQKEKGRLLGNTVELEGVRKGGEEFPIELSLSTWVASGDRYFAAIIRDITERQQLEEELLQIQDEERQRLGRELHDGVCSLLTSAGIVTSTLAERMDKGDPITQGDLDEVTDYITKAGNEARALSHGLSPVGLERGLVPALEELVSQNDGRGELACSFTADDEMPDLPKETATHLYRIAQEALDNVLTHADAGSIQLRLTNDEENALVLRIEDDGRGFSGAPETNAGLGMRTMRRRASLIGGNLAVEERDNGGTTVRCRLVPGTHDVE